MALVAGYMQTTVTTVNIVCVLVQFCVWFINIYWKYACPQTFSEANVVVVPCNVALRFAGHRTIEMLGLVALKV